MDFNVADSVRRDIKVLVTKTCYTVHLKCILVVILIWRFKQNSQTTKLKSPLSGPTLAEIMHKILKSIEFLTNFSAF